MHFKLFSHIRKVPMAVSVWNHLNNALQTLEHVCLQMMSLLFDFMIWRLKSLAFIFYHLVAKWQRKDFFQFQILYSWRINFCQLITINKDIFFWEFDCCQLLITISDWYWLTWLFSDIDFYQFTMLGVRYKTNSK